MMEPFGLIKMIKGLQRQIYKENTNNPDNEQGFYHINDALG